ncbi:nuclear protein 96-domain-containing protein [Kockovaella imperatae]|uniref:Nuclear protein 96-domain-containing protein n=1 Tax=Kockovaella imperatae TaxID=4999 RepID=A0A1Y1UQ44_9TREE|nr:nuclear protein 96-domain-containing protein [Kockovaella imperatae]ORX39687.1 nuclear protein 96-domain-containing protein [Kockovaella imperatae]
MFGSSTWGQQNNQQQNQQPQQQQQQGGGLFGGGTGGFGQPQQNTGFGQTSTFGQPQQQQNTGGLFGSSSTTNTGFGGGGFGSTQQTQNNAFGARPAFGATGTSTFGGTTGTFGSQPQQTGGLFGARPATTSTFGSSTGSNMFGSAPSTSTFGASSSANPNSVQPYSAGPFPPPPQTGTLNPAYYPTWNQEPSTSSVNTLPPHLFNSISAQPDYRGGSYEELRFLDYQQNRKHPTAQATGGFGQPATTSTFGQPTNTFGQPAASTSTFGQPKPGGLFGSTTGGTGFGQSTGGFGSTPQSGGLFGQQNQQNQPATGGLFGSQPQQSQQTGGLFGQTQQNQPQTGGLFGAQNNTNTGGGLFGSTIQNNQTSTFGGFGAKPATTGFGSTPAFGQTNTNTFGQQPATTGNTGFSFGAQQQQPQQNTGGLFGSTANNQPSGGLFGANTQQQNQQQQQSGGLFGSTAAKPGGLFGNPTGNTGTTSTGFGGFGQTPAPAQTSGGLFGATNTNTNTTGGLFGQQQPQTQQPAQTSTGGLFGSTNNAFGAKPAAPTTSLFGSTQPAQPAQSSSLFGSTAQPSTTFGATNNTFGQQNQTQQKPFSFGNSFGSTTQQPTAQPSTGLFGNLGQSQPAQTNTFGTSSLFGSQPQPAQPSGGLFGSSLGQSTTQNQPQPTLTASIDQNPYGRSDLFNYTGQKLELTASTKKPALPPLTSFNFRVTPTKSQLNKLRGFSSPLTASQSPSRVASPLASSSPRASYVNSPSTTDRYKGLTDAALSPNAFVPRPSIKKLTVHPKSSLMNGDDPLDSVLGKSALKSSNGTPSSSRVTTAASPKAPTFNSPSTNGSVRRQAGDVTGGSERQPKKGEYWCKPRLEKLRQLGTGELKALHNFTVGRKGYGEVTFLEAVDLSSIDLNDLFGRVVLFNDMELAVYPDDYEDKPPQGKGLNQPAQITLENCWPKDKSTKQPITDLSDPRHTRFLKRVKTIPNTEFVSYTDDGMWTFKVEHFSRYGIDEDSEDSDHDGREAEAESEHSRSNEASISGESPSESDDDDSDDFIPPTRGLHDDESSPSEETASQTEASSIEDDAIEPPPSVAVDNPAKSRLGSEGMRKLREMQASLFAPQRHDTLLDKQEQEYIRYKRTQDFEPAEGDNVMLDRAVKRTSFGAPQPTAQQLRTPRKFQRVKLLEGIDHGSDGVQVDAGLALGRSFRVSWGPNGELAHLGKICGPNEQFHASPEPLLTIETVPLLAEPDTLESRESIRLLQVQLDKSQIDIDDGVPVSTFDSSTRFRDLARLFDRGDTSHGALVWRLGVALFDEIDLHLSADCKDDFVHRISEIRRKLALSKWLEDAVAPSVDRDLLTADKGPEEVFTLLSGHQLERSVQSALDNGDMRLATLISQIGSSDSFRAEIERQLGDWSKYKASALISGAYRRLYALLAGTVDVLPGDKSRGVDGCPDVLVSDRLDWKRAFGLRLWYGNPFEDTIGDVFHAYRTQLHRAHPPAKPLPPYLETTTDSRSWKMATEPVDVLFGLINLFADVGVSLDQVLRSRDCTSSPFDARIQWHLYMLLAQALKKRDFEDRDGGYSATADTITTAYATQLEGLGLWTWSAFILLHLETAEGRVAAIQALLHRHPVPTQAERAFLIDKLSIPAAWIAQAEADELASEDEPYGEFTASTEAEDYDRAHRVLLTKLAPELILCSDHFLLRRLCTQLAEQEVAGWEYGGKLFLDYVDISDELPTLLANMLRSALDADGSMVKRVTHLAQAIPRVLSLVPALFPRKDDVQQTAALAEMLSNLHHLAGQVYLAGYIPRPTIPGHVANADKLHLMQSQAQDMFEKQLAGLPVAA